MCVFLVPALEIRRRAQYAANRSKGLRQGLLWARTVIADLDRAVVPAEPSVCQALGLELRANLVGVAVLRALRSGGRRERPQMARARK
jgi:hypothetical protein